MEENTNKFADKSVIIGIVIIIVLIVIFSIVRIKGSDDAIEVKEGVMDENGEQMEADGLIDRSGDTVNNSALAIASIPKTSMKVKIPILAGEIFDQAGAKKRGCDTVVFVEKTVARTPAVLNATLKTLFETNEDFGFLPGNFIATQTNLSFDRATIENGVAKVYLVGSTGPLAGVCDDPRLQIQVEESALQFDTVSSVEIFLNGEKYVAPSEE